MDRQTVDRLDRYLAANDLESVWLATPGMFGWLTGGGNLIAREGEAGVAAAGHDGDGVTVLTTNIEGERLLDEELPAGTAVETFPWHEEDLAGAVAEAAAAPAAADVDVPGLGRVDRTALTQPLRDADVRRYREVSGETALALEAVAREVTPEDTERELAAELHRALQARGVESSVVLVGGEDRVQRYRHFTPQEVAVGGYAVLTVVGVRAGINVAVTRTVAFDGAPDWLETRYDDVCRVAATAAAATREAGRSGGTSGDVFAAVRDAYDDLGYPGETENHHQGGAMGFRSREWMVTPGGDEPVRLPMTFGYNPTVPGAKSEDTVLVTGGEVEVLTDTDEFPTRTVRAVDRDLELTVPDVLRQ